MSASEQASEQAERLERTQEAIQQAVEAARRAESGEFVFATREEVSAFVNALPKGVKVRWTAVPSLGSYRYSVTFWRGLFA